MAWVAHCDDIGRDVADHDRASPDGHVVANGDPGQDGDIATYPHIVTDTDRLCPFLAAVALLGVSAVTGSVDTDMGAYEAIVADGDTGLIKHGEVEVGEKPFSDTDLLSVVTIKRLVDDDFVVGHMSEHRFEQLPFGRCVCCWQRVILLHPSFATVQLFKQLWVYGGV